MENEITCYELLTAPLSDEEAEYLKANGAGWFLKRRAKFLKFLKAKGEDWNGLDAVSR